MATKWLSDTSCDFCARDATTVGEFFVDGKTVYGPWALMCKECSAKVGPKVFGTGIGQAYDSKTREKVAG